VSDLVRSPLSAADRCAPVRPAPTVGPEPRVAVVFAVPVAVPVAELRGLSLDFPHHSAISRPVISPRSPRHTEVGP
jgi:hypothetical protein